MKNNKQFILFFILGLLILSVIFMMVVFYHQSKRQYIKIKADAINQIDQRMKNTYTEINNFPSGPADDLLFLSKLVDFQKIINNPKQSSEIEQGFLDFLAKTDAYYQINYVNKLGVTQIRAEFDGREYKIISDLKDQNKEDISQFNLLKNGTVYIYPLSLENKIPVLKYVTPIFNQKGNNFEGIVLVKIYADYFLDSIRRSQRQGEVTYLINTDGFYLANPDRSKEFGNLSGNEKYNFFVDYPSIVKDDFIKCSQRHWENGEKIFTYHCLNPATSNFEIYEGSKTIDEKLINNYQWILITVTDKYDGLKDYKQRYDYLWAICIQILIQGIVFVLFLMNNKLYEKNN